MELTSNAQLTNLRSSLIMTHILNLTYSISENSASTLMVSTTNVTAIAEAVVTESFLTFGSISRPRSADQPWWAFKSSGRNGRPDNPEVETLEAFNKYFSTVIDPAIIATGIIGNAVLALVFMITPLRLRPLSHVLSVLGMTDLIYMVSYMMVYLSNNGVRVYEIPGACQILNFTLTISKSIQAWYIFVSHLNRLKAQATSGSELQKQRVFKTKFAIFMIALLVAAPLLHILWSMETVKVAATTYCTPMRETIFLHLTLKKIEIIATVLLPLMLIAGVDLMLVVKLIMSVAFKKGDSDCKESPKKGRVSSSCPDNATVMSLQQKDYCQDNSFAKNENVEHQMTTAGEDLSLALQIAYHLLKETPTVRHCDANSASVLNTNETEALSNGRDKLYNVPQNISISITSLHDNGLKYFKPLSETYRNDNIEYNQCLSLVDTEKQHISTEPLNSEVMEITHTKELAQPSESVVELCKDDSKMDKRDLVSNSQILIVSDSKGLNKLKQFSVVNLVLSSIKKFRLSPRIPADKHRHFLKQQYNNVCKHTIKSDMHSDIISETVSMSQYENYDSTSSASFTPRRTATPEDHTFSRDTKACTLTIVLLGVIFAITVLPSTYTHAVRLFLDSPASRPTAQAMQQAILFESFVKINAVYKLFLYALIMPSFRSAIIWLLTHWIPSKITRMSSICRWKSWVDKNEMAYV